MPFASTRSAGSQSKPVGRWIHTFSWCPVSVAVRSEAEMNPGGGGGGGGEAVTVGRVAH
jgi:hypothetical protein